MRCFAAIAPRPNRPSPGASASPRRRPISKRFLVAFLQPLLKQHPQLVLNLRLEDEITDAVEAQIDIGIRRLPA